MIDVEAAARNEVETELVTLGLHATSMDLVSPLGTAEGRRFAYRVVTADGQTVKARHLGPPRMRTVCAPSGATSTPRSLRCSTSPVPCSSKSGSPAHRLGHLDSTPWFEPAGALLGRLHHARARRGCDLHPIVDRGGALGPRAPRGAEEITVPEATALRARLHATDPGAARLGLIHKDFCADNFVIDTAGALRVIDNELLDIDPIGFDLGRTFHLWPMDDGAWTAFHQRLRVGRAASAGCNRLLAHRRDARRRARVLARSRVRLDETVRLLLQIRRRRTPPAPP